MIHPAALNLTHSLTSTPPSSTQPLPSHPRHDPPTPGGILSPVLDSMRIQWGATGGNEGGHDTEGGKERRRETLGHQSLKGISLYYVRTFYHAMTRSSDDPLPCIFAFLH